MVIVGKKPEGNLKVVKWKNDVRRDVKKKEFLQKYRKVENKEGKKELEECPDPGVAGMGKDRY